MRFCFLLNGVSGYFSTCIETLASRPDVDDVLVLTKLQTPDAEFSPEHVTPGGVTVEVFDEIPPGRDVLPIVARFKPDVLVLGGWQLIPYRFVARHLKPSPLRVVCMDNQWLGTTKQRLGVLASAIYLQPLFDAVFLPGDRQAHFARKLGFRDAQIWTGLYTGEHSRFSKVYEERMAGDSYRREDAFVFVGRLVEAKGVDVLASAYSLYRSRTAYPWPLLVSGTGPLEPLLRGVEGVKLLGFLQPSELPEVFSRAGCLVLPSVFEPWGVVVHEATAAGLAVICTSACGSGPFLVEDGYNGYIVEPSNRDELARALERCSSLTQAERTRMAVNAHNLSLRYTPERWADVLLTRSAEALQAVDRPRVRPMLLSARARRSAQSAQ